MKHGFLYFLLVITPFSCQEKPNNTLRIATAANAQYAIREIALAFTQQTEINVDIIQGSSGKLLAQIKEGAPYDVFVSADMKYPNKLYTLGLTDQKPAVYGYGKLVLFTSQALEPTLNLLTKSRITHIALPNPKTAPYGLAAKEVLEYYNMHEDLKKKLVYGENISQTTQFINSGAAEIGFTALSIVMSPQLKNVGHWLELDSTTYSPIAQGVVIIKRSKKSNENAQQFYLFLFSNKAKNILKKYGY
ncbi:MAG: molybdate ABC transporter substrate-binding protein [Cyclobacteriaceae bacterium]|nr:molybdate ABC transporter substrate-binding protein [Cyclobacteriaceae bacterium]